jgi:localization factor PodJL
MTWSVRGIDDEVREAALAAARRSGKPVGEWLNGVIRQTAAPEPEPATASTVPSDEVGRLERGLAALAERLDRLRTAEAPVARERADLGPIAAALQEQIDRLTPAAQPQRRAAPIRERVRAEVQFVAEPQEDPRLGSVLDALDALDRRLQAMATPARAAPAQPLAAQPAPVPPPPPAPVAAAPQPTPALNGSDRIGDLERAIAAIGRRQQALEPERAPGPERRPAARPLLASDMERHFKELTGRLDKLAASPATARPADERLGSELRDLRGVVEQGFATRLAPIADSVGELRAGLDRLQQEMARSRRDDRLDAVLEGLAALRDDVVDTRRADPAPALATFERAHADLVRRLDALRADTADAGAVSDLRAEIADLRTSLSARDSDAGIAALESRLVALGRRIDQLVAGRGESFAALDEIRAALAERRPAPDFGRVEARLDALDRHMETLNAVEARIGDLGARLDTLEPGGVPPAALAAIADEITGLGRRLDRLPKTGGAASEEVLATVADRLQDLGAGIDRLERRPAGAIATGSVDLPLLGELADRIEAAAARLDRVTAPVAAPQADTTLIAAIDDKFAQIARQLDTAEDRFTTLGAIEDALVEIHRLVSQRGPSGSPEEAARAAVAEFARLAERDGSGKALDSVVAELETLRAQTQGLEARTADGLKAVQEALTSVAGLLQQGRSVDGVSRAARNPREDARPLEPGSGKPDPAPEMPRTAAPVVVAPVAPVEDEVTEAVAVDGLASSRRADFIAAARRAAQAAQTARIAEPQPELDDPDAAQTRQGPLARIGAALRGRTRPVATIIAVLLLAGIATEISLNGLERLRRGLEPVGNRIVALTPAPAPAMSPAAPAAPTVDPVETGTVARPPVTAPRAAAPAPEALAAPVQPGTFSTAPTVRDGFVADSLQTGAITPKPAPAAPQAAAPEARPSYPLPEEKAGSLALRQAAAAGEAQAAFEIAQRYAEGRGVAQNGTAAIEWFRRAAEAGFAPAQYRLASGLEKGMGGNRDLAEAKRWYQAAADQGNVRAMHNLGVIFANERDMTNALPWFQKAGDLGLKDSQFNLGIIHALGSGVKQDLAVSYKWFSLAAAQGDQEAGKKRDDIAQYLDKTALASAKLAVDTWKARPLERAANDETTRWAGEIAPAQSADAERVSRVQALLKAQGSYAGPIDGQVSADTKAAVKAFQRKAGLKPTGEVDDALVRALSAGKTAA